jgi:6-phosphogluconolactonase/glucosamine-6-phosphate isomerase/deaminase
MRIHTHKTAILAEEAAKAIDQKLSALNTAPLLLLISGGSALSLLDHIDTSLLNQNVTVSVFDDRFTSDPKQNNFFLLFNTDFYSKALMQGASNIDTSVYSELTLEQFGQDFENQLKQWRKENPDGKVVATMGIGPDGHTGGMMPYPEDPAKFKKLFEAERWAVGYNSGTAKNPFPERITVTMSFIRKYLDYAAVYVSGENKRPSLLKMLAPTGELAASPCRIIREIPEADIFTDVSLDAESLQIV